LSLSENAIFLDEKVMRGFVQTSRQVIRYVELQLQGIPSYLPFQDTAHKFSHAQKAVCWIVILPREKHFRKVFLVPGSRHTTLIVTVDVENLVEQNYPMSEGGFTEKFTRSISSFANR